MVLLLKLYSFFLQKRNLIPLERDATAKETRLAYEQIVGQRILFCNWRRR
jgi:hypothetical protein